MQNKTSPIIFSIKDNYMTRLFLNLNLSLAYPYAKADLACSTIDVKLAGSLTAISANTFLSKSMFANFNPWMNLL